MEKLDKIFNSKCAAAFYKYSRLNPKDKQVRLRTYQCSSNADPTVRKREISFAIKKTVTKENEEVQREKNRQNFKFRARYCTSTVELLKIWTNGYTFKPECPSKEHYA